MNTRPIVIVLGALIAVLLFFNGLTMVLLLRLRSENESLRAQLAAPSASLQRGGEMDQKMGLPPGAGAASVPPDREPDQAAMPRNAFLQNNFTNFQVINFRAATNGEAVIQRLKVNQHMLGTFAGERHTGFRFTVPEWIDGDFEWMYFHLTNEENKRRRVQAQWFIVPEQGEMTANLERYVLKPLTTYPLLKKRFPNSREAYHQTLPRDRLQPGRSYAIWFGYLDASNVPDIAVALTLNSPRGHREFGTLPLK